jgi:uncharacterized protein (UPF0216 family)
MRVLSSKCFFIPEGTGIALNDIEAWFGGIYRGQEDCSLVVTLRAMDGKRRQKKSALRELKELMADGIAENEDLPLAWERYDYRLKFLSGKYYWRGKEIHVTANERLFLYRWLVLHEDTCKLQMYYLRHMRRRLGKEFLAEVTG